jgi:glucan phosphoethanolaminetransferase (alkaline phosphatase superfamily)
MATAHGAGLMLAPLLVPIADSTPMHDHAMPRQSGVLGLAVVVHTFAMLLVMATVAWIVYRRLGLAVLRRSWINFDLIWAVALLVVGAVALGRGLWELGVRA